MRINNFHRKNARTKQTGIIRPLNNKKKNYCHLLNGLFYIETECF